MLPVLMILVGFIVPRLDFRFGDLVLYGLDCLGLGLRSYFEGLATFVFDCICCFSDLGEMLIFIFDWWVGVGLMLFTCFRLGFLFVLDPIV